jgi:hypothetical protein
MHGGSLERDTAAIGSSTARRKKQRNESHILELGRGSDNEFSEYDTKEEDDATRGDVVTDGLKHIYRNETWSQQSFTYV